MSNNKVHFVVEESFKTEDKTQRIKALQNLFLEIVKTYEPIDEQTIPNNNLHKKELPNE